MLWDCLDNLVGIELHLNAASLRIRKFLVELGKFVEGVAQGRCRYVACRDDIATVHVSFDRKYVVEPEAGRRNQLVPGGDGEGLRNRLKIKKWLDQCLAFLFRPCINGIENDNRLRMSQTC